MPQLIIFGWFYAGSTVSARLNSTRDSPGEQRYANVKLATGLLPVDFTMFFSQCARQFAVSHDTLKLFINCLLCRFQLDLLTATFARTCFQLSHYGFTLMPWTLFRTDFFFPLPTRDPLWVRSLRPPGCTLSFLSSSSQVFFAINRKTMQYPEYSWGVSELAKYITKWILPP